MDLNQQVKKKETKIAAILQNLVQLSQQPFVGVMERVCCIIISTDAHVSGVSSFIRKCRWRVVLIIKFVLCFLFASRDGTQMSFN